MAMNRPIERQDGGTYESRAVAEGWRSGAAARAQFLGPLTEAMLDVAGVTSGSRVLDVADGTGEQTLMAARRVGPTGSIVATDIAPRMLAVAAEAAQQAGLTNVETRVLDARRLDLEPESFDAAISRLALMLIPEREQALVGVRRVLKPGSKLAAVVLSAPARNPFTALPVAIARRHAGLPPMPVEDPGLFALGDAAIFRAVYERAGFRDVAVHAVPVLRRFPSVGAALQFRRDSGPEVSKLLASLSDGEREAVWDEIGTALRQFAGSDAVAAPGEYLIGVGTK